jgi:hypothetical protein
MAAPAPGPRPQPLLLLLLVALLAASAPRRADAWGKEGHIMVCKIAEVRPLPRKIIPSDRAGGC